MVDKKNILFLNPPGKKIYIRDYYCSKVSKAYYLPQPVDLLMQTAHFNSEQYNLKVIDAIAEKKSVEQTIQEATKFNPDLIIGQIGSASLDEDVAFYAELKQDLPSAKIACSGDALLEEFEVKFKDYNWLDLIITNFYSNGPTLWFTGQADEAQGIVYLENGQLIEKAAKRSKPMDMAVPQQKLFTGNYRMPFANAEPIATVLTNYACPYPCTFCIMSTLPYTPRTAESIIEELKYLKAEGYRFIYFSDQTFYQSKAITKHVLEWMVEVDYGISWMCFSRVDVVDKNQLTLMKKAGCKLIMFGVEWAENERLEHYKKHYTVDQIRATFKLAKELKIQRLGTFLIGVPGQTEASILNTVKFAIEIDADYASFNVAVPRSNTSFREEAINEGLIEEDDKSMDQSGSFIAMGTGELNQEEVMRLKKKAYRKFYFRFGYLWKRLRGLSNWVELKSHFNEGWFIVKSLFRK
ncbi:MAG: anaerobic magnesium-protoporphyrin IX monomethyl ester cyclase [Crocinitomix sp.]|jgi:anaerobic magnesium-protoporphyrin IX monomethyl ester cyclase